MENAELTFLHPESKAAERAEQKRMNTFLTHAQVEQEYGPQLRELGMKPESYVGKPRRNVERDIAATTAENAEIMAGLLDEAQWYKPQH